MKKGLCSESRLSVTVSEPITSLLSSVPTPWVNEAGLTPSHPPNVPALEVREADTIITRRGRAALQEKELRGLICKAPSPHTTVCQKEKGSPGRGGGDQQPAGSLLPTQDPNQMLLFTGPQLLPVLPYPGAA